MKIKLKSKKKVRERRHDDRSLGGCLYEFSLLLLYCQRMILENIEKEFKRWKIFY